MGIIDLQGPFEPNLDVPGFGKLQTKTKSDIENLEGQHRALKEAIVALENDRPRNAIKLLEPFVQTETPSVDALAYIAVAMIQSNVVGLRERRMNLQRAHCPWAISIPSLMRL